VGFLGHLFMKVFFDTEFTGLHKDTSLISLGLVDENGRTFYAEFLGYNSNQVDDWIQKNVINNLKYKTCIDNWCNEDWEHLECVGYTYYIKTLLANWLSKYESVELVSDVCHYDMVLFIDIFGGAFDLPENVSPACHDINQDIARYFNISEREAFDKSREEIADAIQGDKHNALYDAFVIRNIYQKLI
jgi:hypothetical protein